MHATICFLSNIPNGIYTIFGVIIGASITYLFNRNSARKAAFYQIFVSAAIKFIVKWEPIHSKITKEINDTESIDIDVSFRFATEIHDNWELKISTITFRRYLTGKRRTRFDSLCIDLFGINNDEKWYPVYCCGTDHNQPKNIQKEKEIEARKELLNKVESLLSFAETDET